MAEQVQITLFTFDELPEESQQQLIEGFQQDYEPDYQHIYDAFILEMSEQIADEVFKSTKNSYKWQELQDAVLRQVLNPAEFERYMKDKPIKFIKNNIYYNLFTYRI